VMDGLFTTPQDPDREEDGKRLASMASGFAIAVKAGRLFDMGHIPNAVLRSESKRAGDLAAAGRIGHPFTQPYCFYHTWDAESVGNDDAQSLAHELHVGDAGSLYLVDALDWNGFSGGQIPSGSYLVCEAQAVKVFGRGMLLIGDSAMVSPGPGPNGEAGYSARVTRGVMSGNTTITDLEAAGNLVDPVMTCQLLLATDGVEVITVEAPERLNKQRVKARKLPIPSHYSVRTAGYITALTTRHTRRPEAPTGHHASPVPHLRRGHTRQLHAMHGGGQIWVRDAVINLKDPDAPLARSFYQRQQEAHANNLEGVRR